MTLPVVSDPFYWTDEPWGPALRCRAIDAITPHLFTTRTLQLSAPADWARLAEAVNASAVVTLTQVHGNRAVVVRRGEAVPLARPEADVLVSDNPDVAIAVRAADCVPLLIADSRTGVVAAVARRVARHGGGRCPRGGRDPAGRVWRQSGRADSGHRPQHRSVLLRGRLGCWSMRSRQPAIRVP